MESRKATIQAALTRMTTERQKIRRLISDEPDPPKFIVCRAREVEVESNRLLEELNGIARAGLEAEEAALAKVRTKVEGLWKLLAPPVPQARSALRRLGVRVTLSYKIIDGCVSWYFEIE